MNFDENVAAGGNQLLPFRRLKHYGSLKLNKKQHEADILSVLQIIVSVLEFDVAWPSWATWNDSVSDSITWTVDPKIT